MLGWRKKSWLYSLLIFFFKILKSKARFFFSFLFFLVGDIRTRSSREITAKRRKKNKENEGIEEKIECEGEDG